MYSLLLGSDTESLDYYYDRSKMGNRVLVVGGYRYKLMRRKAGKDRWICIKTQLRCNAFAVTINEDIVQLCNKHTH